MRWRFLFASAAGSALSSAREVLRLPRAFEKLPRRKRRLISPFATSTSRNQLSFQQLLSSAAAHADGEFSMRDCWTRLKLIQSGRHCKLK
mmetsp:Transcript_26106/g.54820  ORF Transcript_26106/g.54820 Transcript_26106/m.54820 type:complete len:90 (-) Transcript_26106:336-605(-)